MEPPQPEQVSFNARACDKNKFESFPRRDNLVVHRVPIFVYVAVLVRGLELWTLAVGRGGLAVVRGVSLHDLVS